MAQVNKKKLLEFIMPFITNKQVIKIKASMIENKKLNFWELISRILAKKDLIIIKNHLSNTSKEEALKQHPFITKVDLINLKDKINIKGMLEGSESDFVAIYNRHQQPIRAYLHSLYYPDIICCADEIHIDTFMKFRKALPKFRGEESVKNRLRRIAYGLYLDCMRRVGEIFIHVSLDHLTNNNDYDTNEDDDEIDSKELDTPVSAPDLPSSIEIILCIQNCFDYSLKPASNKNKCIKGLTLYAIGTTYKEIAVILKIASDNSAKNLLFRCRKKLTKKSQLENCLESCSSKVKYKETDSHVK